MVAGARRRGEPWLLWAPAHGVVRDRLVARRPPAGLRRRRGPPRATSSGRRRRGARRPPGGSPGSTGAGTRSATVTAGTRSGSWRSVRGARPRQLTRGPADVKGIAWSPRRSDDRLRRRPAPRRGRAAAARRSGSCRRPAAPRARLVRAGRVRRARRPSRPTGAGSPASGWTSRTPSTTRARGSSSPRPDGSGPAVALAPDLDRPIGAWKDTDLNGWMTRARCGPWWAGADALVALVSEAGRAVPWRFPVDPAPAGRPGAPERLVAADAACWGVGVSRTVGTRTTRSCPWSGRSTTADGAHDGRGRGPPRAPPDVDAGSAARGDAASPGRRCAPSSCPAPAARSRPGSRLPPAPPRGRCPRSSTSTGADERRLVARPVDRGRPPVRPRLPRAHAEHPGRGRLRPGLDARGLR